MNNDTNKYCKHISFLIVDNYKNIVSFQSYPTNQTDFFNKSIQIGHSIIEITPEEHRLYLSELLDNCIHNKSIVINDCYISGQSDIDPVLLLLIPLPLYANLSHTVCIFLHGLSLTDSTSSFDNHLGFTSHKLRPAINSILSLSNLKNHPQLNPYEGLKITELFKNIYTQAERLNDIVIKLHAINYGDKGEQ